MSRQPRRLASVIVRQRCGLLQSSVSEFLKKVMRCGNARSATSDRKTRSRSAGTHRLGDGRHVVGERQEDSFEVCWNCGTARAGVEDPTFTRAEGGENAS